MGISDSTMSKYTIAKMNRNTFEEGNSSNNYLMITKNNNKNSMSLLGTLANVKDNASNFTMSILNLKIWSCGSLGGIWIAVIL